MNLLDWGQSSPHIYERKPTEHKADISGRCLRSYLMDQTKAQVGRLVPHYTKPTKTQGLNISAQKREGLCL